MELTNGANKMSDRYIVILLLLLLTVGCSTTKMVEYPLGYSLMPRYSTLDSMLLGEKKEDSSKVVDSSYEDYESIAIDGGKLIDVNGDTVELPGGVLISDYKAAMYLYYRSMYERREREIKYLKYILKSYEERMREGEKIYQYEITRLIKERERSWLERNIGYIGYILGISTTLMLFYVTRE